MVNEKEIKKMIELQRAKEATEKMGMDFATKEAEKAAQLKKYLEDEQYKDFVNKSADEMQIQLDKLLTPPKPVSTTVGSENEGVLKSMSEEYDELFKKEDGSYKEGYAKPEPDESGKGIKLTFPDEESCFNFIEQQAAKRDFVILSHPDHKLIGFAQGGTLYNHEGEKMGLEDFKNPKTPRPDFDRSTFDPQALIDQHTQGMSHNQ